MKRINQYLIGLLILILGLDGGALHAQKSALVRANTILAENPLKAVKILDSVVRHAETKTLSVSWTLRGRAYYELCRVQNYSTKAELLDSIFISVQRSFDYLPDSNITKDNYILLRYISKRFYNMASLQLKDTTLMKSMAADKSNNAAVLLKRYHANALTNFNKFKSIYETYFPNMDVRKYELEFYEALGSYFSYLFEKDNSNAEAGSLAKSAYLKVLQIDPNNVFANIQMGLLYYNQAANIIQKLNEDTPLEELDLVQDNLVKLGKQSEQFVSKGYQNDQNNLKAIEALFYIYRLLNDFNKSNEFKSLGLQKGLKLEETQPQK